MLTYYNWARDTFPAKHGIDVVAADDQRGITLRKQDKHNPYRRIADRKTHRYIINDQQHYGPIAELRAVTDEEAIAKANELLSHTEAS